MRRPPSRGGGAWVALSTLLCLGAVVVTAIAGEAGGGLATAGLARALDWQPALGLREPWRLWTGAWVHWSGAHLFVNALGALVVAFVGRRALVPATAALAWFIAWPLTQALMAAVDPARLAALMPHYGGLSGVLHAGVIVLGLELAWPARTRDRAAATRAGAAASGGEPSRITEGPWAMTELGASTAVPAPTFEQAPSPVMLADAARLRRARTIGAAILAGTLLKVLLEAPWALAPRPSAALGVAVAPIAHACGVAAGALAWILVRALARPPGRAPERHGR